MENLQLLQMRVRLMDERFPFPVSGRNRNPMRLFARGIQKRTTQHDSELNSSERGMCGVIREATCLLLILDH